MMEQELRRILGGNCSSPIDIPPQNLPRQNKEEITQNILSLQILERATQALRDTLHTMNTTNKQTKKQKETNYVV
jgi:hypothetical protein